MKPSRSCEICAEVGLALPETDVPVLVTLAPVLLFPDALCVEVGVLAPGAATPDVREQLAAAAAALLLSIVELPGAPAASRSDRFSVRSSRDSEQPARVDISCSR